MGLADARAGAGAAAAPGGKGAYMQGVKSLAAGLTEEQERAKKAKAAQYQRELQEQLQLKKDRERREKDCLVRVPTREQGRPMSQRAMP